jgi:hypothetical protein
MPNGVDAVTPSSCPDRRIHHKFKAVRERVEDRWRTDPDDVSTFVTACESPIERLFVIDLVEEAAGRLERASTVAARPDEWFLTVSSPFSLQKRLHTSPWLRIFPQRPILTPEDDDKWYRQVDFLLELWCDESPAGKNGQKCIKRFFVETEGHDFHCNSEQRGRDHDRVRQLMRLGLDPIRFTGSQVNSSSHSTAAEALELAWQRGARPLGGM